MCVRSKNEIDFNDMHSVDSILMYAETVVITKGSLDPACEISIGQSSLKQVDRLKYFGTIITGDGRCEQEIRSRIKRSKQIFNKLKNILTNKHLSFQIGERLLQCYVCSVLTYGWETWVLSKAVGKRVQATEIWFFRRMQKIPWIANRTYESVLI